MNTATAEARSGQSLKDRIETARAKSTREVGGAIGGINAIASALGMTETSGKLRVIFEKLNDDTFKLIVVGRFKNGKSTLMNALLGKINGSVDGLGAGIGPMPVNDLPTTATLTSIQYSDRPSVRVFRFDGKHEDWSFLRYMTDSRLRPDETENGFFDQIEEFRVNLPAELCKSGVTLLDSPGTDEDPKRTAVTMRALEQCDAAIVTYASQPLIGMDEKNFASSVMSSGTKVFTVVNMFHGRKPDDQFRSFVWNKLVREGPTGAPYANQDLSRNDIFFVDAKAAEDGKLAGNPARVAESGMAAFETRVADFLLNDRHHAHLNAFVTRAEIQAAAVETAISQRLSGLRKDQAELENKAREVVPQLAAIDRKTAGLESLFDTCRSRAKQDVQVAFGALVLDLRRGVPTELAKTPLKSFKGFTGNVFPQFRQKEAVKEASKIAQDYVARRINLWGSNKADFPGAQQSLKPVFERLIEDVEKEITRIDQALNDIHLNLTGWKPAEIDPSKGGPSSVQKAVAVGAGVLLGDIGLAFGGGAGGFRGLAGTMGGYVASALVLTLMGASAPIVVPALLISAILGGGFGVRLGAEGRVKATVTEHINEELSKLPLTAAPQLEEEVDKLCLRIRTEIMSVVNGIVDAEKQSIRKIIDDNRRGQAEKNQLRGQLEESLRNLATQRTAMKNALVLFKQQG